MKDINKITGKNYKPFEYYGDPKAKYVIVAMGSVCETIKEFLDYKNTKIGLIEVHLYRPFSSKYLLDVLPKTTKKIAVLDRAKEPGSLNEPLCLDIIDVIKNNNLNIEVYGGRYGLSSKNTNLNDIEAVYNNLKSQTPKKKFTIGINDDITNLSLERTNTIFKKDYDEVLIYGYGSDGMITTSKDILTIIGENTNKYVQGYFEYDSKKSGGVTKSHLRFSSKEIKSTYYVETPKVVICSKDTYLDKFDMLKGITKNGIFILNTEKEKIKLPSNYLKTMKEKNIKFYTVNASKIASDNGIPNKISMIMENVITQESSKAIEFNYYLPVNIVFGSGKVLETGELAKPYGKKALIVTGRSSAKRSGLYDKVNDSLKAAGLETVLFDKVSQNPLTTTAQEGADFAKANGCDVVVAIGGGSIMDCAKAIAFLSKNEGDINDYIYNRLTSDDALPLILIPTTCGTGSEGNGFAVLTNPDNGDKKSLRCNAIVAKVSIVDPECMMTMPKKVLASVTFDALCHNIEAYTSKIAQPLTDAMSIYAIELIANNLVSVYNGTGSKKEWENITMASTIGGMVINTAGVTIAHGMEHPASGLKDIVHGQGLAALTPIVIEASYKGNEEKFAKIAKIFGGESAADCADKIRELLKAIDLECKLSDLGIAEEDIPWMAENCMKVSAASIANNPVVFTQEEIAELYRKAL